MRLSTMWHVDRTVASDGTSPIATALAAPWRPDEPPVFFRSSANFVYTLQRDEQLCYLRFAASAEGASRDLVEAELAAMARARACGIATPVPLLTSDGAAVSVADVGGRAYVAVTLTSLDGEQLEGQDTELERCKSWGGLVARVQQAIAFPAWPQAAARWSWQDQMVTVARELRSAPAPVVAELVELAAEMGSWPTDAMYGLVHLDIEPDNIRWVGAEPGLLDFDGCARHWYAVDVASALRDIDDDAERREAFLSGYEAAGGAPVRERLGIARRWLDLTSYATVARSLDVVPDDDHPVWLTTLRGRLEDRQRAYVDALDRR
jgi:Ser/Thr protein kinase RdoA (MazF antagonist)